MTTPSKQNLPVTPEQNPPVTPGQIIGGRYLVGTLIGQGGMGLVCAATHLGLESPVAIKLIRPDLKDDAEFVERFLNEARRAAGLTSEHIASVHDVGRLETGEPYIVMERLEGMELEAYLRSAGPLDAKRAVQLVLEACEGLEEAHAAGIVHRDLKPANLFLARRSDGKEVLKILDFGISKAVKDDAPSSLTNRSLGSPWYMSPEQMLDASSVDVRADIWSLGVVLFELLTKTVPFDGTTVAEVCAKVLTAPVPSPGTIAPDIDPELDAIIMRCLQKDREQRYPDVRALALDLSAFLARASEREDSRERSSDRYESLTPITGEFELPDNRRRRTRSRWLGVAGVTATLLLAAGTVGTAALTDARLGTRSWVPSLPASLSPGPDAVPLDKGNDPVTAAVVGPLIGSSTPAVAPLETPSPTAVTADPKSRPTHEAGYAVPRPPVLSPSETERRKARYEAWIRDQGLERLDESVGAVSDSPYESTESESDSPYESTEPESDSPYE